jgi:TonB family protein
MKHSRSQKVLDGIGIAAPCQAAWDSMEGDDKVRFCQQCKLNVYNLSAMSADEAAQVLVSQNGSRPPCVRFFQRADGTVLTQNCPVGLRRIRESVVGCVNKTAAVIVSLFSFVSQVRANDEIPTPQKAAPQKVEFLVAPQVPAGGRETMGLPREIMGVPNTDFGPYMSNIQKRIHTHWHEPAGFTENSRIVVAFKIHTDGSVTDSHLTKSSGTSEFDTMALAAIRNSGPFGQLPAGADDSVDIQVTFQKWQSP